MKLKNQRSYKTLKTLTEAFQKECFLPYITAKARASKIIEARKQRAENKALNTTPIRHWTDCYNN